MLHALIQLILKINIDSKCPVYVSAKSLENGHAVTAYGYTVTAGTRYVNFWNSGLNGGDGDSVVVAFKESGTTFSYGNETYTWMDSVSEY